MNLLPRGSFKDPRGAKNRVVSDGRPEHSSGRDSTKAKLSQVTKGEKNPFFGKSHSTYYKNMMSKLHKGQNNPMFNKVKSPEFIEMMYKDKTGANNPNAKSYKLIDVTTGESIIYSTFKEA